MIVSEGGMAEPSATVIATVSDADCAGLPLSIAVAVKLYVPCAVGVPEIAPLEAASERPDGNLPDVIDQVYGAVPPVALNWPLYD